MLLTATQSFCILHIIKHAVHTFCVYLERNAKMKGLFCVFLRLWLFYFLEKNKPRIDWAHHFKKSPLLHICFANLHIK